jgi:hypothetical protein
MVAKGQSMKSLFFLGLWAALPAFAVTIIADPSMNAVDYSIVNLNSAGGAVLGSSSTGTNRFHNMQLPPTNLAPASSLAFQEMNTTHTWDPSANGAITSLAFYLDLGVSPGPVGDQFAFYVSQGGTNLLVLPVAPINGTRTFGWTGNIASPGTVRFGYGYASINPNTFANLVNIVSVDNFCVVVNEGPTAGCGPQSSGGDLPEPGSLAMLGAAGLVAGFVRRRRSRLL